MTIERLPIPGTMRKDARLARALADMGLGEFLRQIRYKARWRGRTLTEASREFARALLCSR